MTEQAVSTIEKDVVVTMEYELKVDGSVIDSGPIQFLQGHGNIIPGLEAEVEGMSFGDEKEILVKSKDAYGEYNPDLEMDISLTSFPEDFKIELGRPMRLQGGDGQIFTGVAMAITDEVVKMNLNHPLAGKDLLFNTKVIDLRAGTPEEISQGGLDRACGGCSSGNCGDC